MVKERDPWAALGYGKPRSPFPWSDMARTSRRQSCLSGSFTRNTAPTSLPCSAQIVPPCLETIFWQSERPVPLPAFLVEKKPSNIFSSRPIGRPRPRYPELGNAPIPVYPYVSTDYYEKEIASIYMQDWPCVEREEEIPKPGDFKVKRPSSLPDSSQD